MFYCKICGEGVDILTRVHVKKHGLTLEEYCLMFPDHCEPKYWGCVTSPATTKKFKKLKREALLNHDQNSKNLCRT